MRILYLSNSYPLTISGVSTVVGNLINWMAKDHTSAIICPNTSTRYHKDTSSISIHYRLPSYKTLVRPDVRFITPNPLQLKKAFVDFQPDIIHLHDPSPASVILKEVALNQKIPVVFSHHFTPNLILGYLPDFLKTHTQNNPNLHKAILQFVTKLYKNSDHLVVPSHTIRSSLSQFTKIPISVISNGINYQRLSHPNPSAINRIARLYHLPTKPFVFYVGRIDPDKNLDILIKAWSHINSSSDQFRLVIVGSGSQVRKLKKLASSLNLSSSITWTGHIPHTELAHIYNHPCAKIFAIPSPIESQSIVTLMALAAGKPVIAANSGALPEIVLPGKTGYLFPPQNPRLFAKKNPLSAQIPQPFPVNLRPHTRQKT
jgi:glycosyltransferase involved in cell wall biosynthesis